MNRTEYPPFSVRLLPSEKQQLTDLARRRDMTRGAFLRSLLKQAAADVESPQSGAAGGVGVQDGR